MNGTREESITAAFRFVSALERSSHRPRPVVLLVHRIAESMRVASVVVSVAPVVRASRSALVLYDAGVRNVGARRPGCLPLAHALAADGTGQLAVLLKRRVRSRGGCLAKPAAADFPADEPSLQHSPARGVLRGTR